MTSWAKRIDVAEHRGRFSADDSQAASNWPTCACGEQDFGIPRDSQGAPRDQQLHELGQRFHAYVQDNMIPEARATLAAIEERAGEVLQQQLGSSR